MANNTVYSSDLFALRPWSLNDLPELVRHANNPAVARNLMDRFPHPYPEENGSAFIQMAMDLQPPQVLCIEVDGGAAGGIGLHPGVDIYKKNAELGYWLAQPFWGRGIGTEAVKRMVDYGFRTLDITRIFARPFGSNKASQRVLEKAGFVLEARFEKTIFKNGVLEDEWVYAVRRSGT